MLSKKDKSYIERYESFTDKLIRYHREPGKHELTAEEEVHWQRINFADDLLRQLHPLKTVTRLLMAKYPDDMSIANAYRDVALAKKIFGFRDPEDKVYMERIMVEKLTKMLQRAMLNDDTRGVAAISKEIREWMGKDTDIDPKLIRGNTYIFNMGGKTTVLESAETVDATVLETIMGDGDLFTLEDDEFLKKLEA